MEITLAFNKTEQIFHALDPLFRPPIGSSLVFPSLFFIFLNRKTIILEILISIKKIIAEWAHNKENELSLQQVEII
jgi:hypothetical protein